MRTRIYRAELGADTPCLSVTLRETYNGSQHWTLEAIPRGYGREPEPLLFGVYDADFASERLIAQREGYGIFRLEFAVSLARALTGATDFESENQTIICKACNDGYAMDGENYCSACGV